MYRFLVKLSKQPKGEITHCLIEYAPLSEKVCSKLGVLYIAPSLM